MPAKICVFIFAFVVICVGLKISGEDCDLVINEVNTGSPERLKKKDFIELKMICDSEQPKSKSLQGYKIIGISADSGTMSIDLVVSLWNSKINEKNMFTVGNDGVSNVDMNCKSHSVSYRNKLTGDTQTLSSFLNKGNKNIHAIALLYKESYAFQEIALTQKNPIIIVDDKLRELIKSNLIDLIVYARKAPYDNCDLLKNLCDEYANKEYILREFDNNNEQGMDRTLNRCSFDRSKFIPEKFKLGSPTPGADNDCSGVNFFLENHLSQLTNTLKNKVFDDENIEHINEIAEKNDGSQCFASVDASAYEQVPDDAIENEIVKEIESANANTCSALNLGPNDGNIADQLDRSNRRKRRLSETVNYEEENEWETMSYFQ